MSDEKELLIKREFTINSGDERDLENKETTKGEMMIEGEGGEEQNESLDIKGQTKMIAIAILMVIVFIFICSLFFCLAEDWSVLNGIYFSVIFFF